MSNQYVRSESEDLAAMDLLRLVTLLEEAERTGAHPELQAMLRAEVVRRAGQYQEACRSGGNP